MSSPRLQVLMTADAVGGVWTYAVDLARGLAERDAHVTLAILGPAPSVAQRARAAAIDGLAVVETGLPLDWTARNAEELVSAGRAIGELSDALGADIAHLHSPALAAEMRTGAKIVATCHSCVATWWQAVRGGPLPADLAWRAGLVRRGYGAADALLAPSAAFARATADAYGLAHAPTVVRNGRGELGTPEPAGDAGRAAAPFAFTAGRLWDEGKNVEALDRAAARLDIPVLAAGPTAGPHGARIALRHVRGLGLVSEDELAAHLRRRPIFVSPATYEPFGLAVLEAAQAGCPLVLSDIPTFRELWDGVATFVPAHDEAALASAIRDLAGDGGRRRDLGRAARERSAVYSVDRMVTGTLARLRAVLAGEAMPPGEAVAA